MPNIFLTDDDLASVLGALEAQGTAIPSALATLRTPQHTATLLNTGNNATTASSQTATRSSRPSNYSSTQAFVPSIPSLGLLGNNLQRVQSVPRRSLSVPLPGAYFQQCFDFGATFNGMNNTSNASNASAGLPVQPSTLLGSNLSHQNMADSLPVQPQASPLLNLSHQNQCTRLHISTDVNMPGSPFSTPSPLTPCPPSPHASTLGKRKAAQIEEVDNGEDEDGDDEEGEEDDHEGDSDYGDHDEGDLNEDEDDDGDHDGELNDEDISHRKRVTIKIPGRPAAGAGGNRVAHRWTDDCPRKGTEDVWEPNLTSGGCAVRMIVLRVIVSMEHLMEGWYYDAEGGPPMTKNAGELLSRLLWVYGRNNRESLEKVLEGNVAANFSASTDITDTAALLDKIDQQSAKLKISELEYMLSLMQLALNVDSEQANAKAQHLPNVSKAKLAEKYRKSKKGRTTFGTWVNWGQRLLMLCAAGSMYMLPIIAALELRTFITRTCIEQDIYCLATAIREVRHGMWLPQVRRMMVPIHYMRSVSGYIQTLELKYNSPVKVGEPPNLQVFRFADITTTDQVFTAIQTNLPILPKRSQEWDFPQSPPLWKPVGGPNHINVLKPITIKSPIALGPQTKKCPVNKKNRNSWTEKQRNIAEVAPLATSIDDLRAKLQDRQEGYVEVNSDIIQPDEALFIRDLNDKLLALLFKVPDEYREGLKAAVDHINTVLEGEFKDADSREEAFKYLSLHYSWYARYAEQGHSAPKDVHCNKSRKTKRGRVNMTQRTPHPSKNMVDKPGEYAVLATAFTDFFELLHVSLESLLPEDTDELSMYVEELPLHASSPCYPFGGFVINISACSWGHRDKKDKRKCLVAPMGKFTGGKLCLYEAGLSFDLKMGDVLVFPSAELTHFNTHFTGRRATLVLHSDGDGGDSWLKDAHGWSTWIVNHRRP
ncbi:hypothetical protein B0H13DRAFT_2323610 [Mycena leptocephala]|nr:hypothetical protein B0H13DRAFT_2323610 [Mycena leptocephala]